MSTSIPQAAVAVTGKPRVSAGSSRVAIGLTPSLLKVSFRCDSESVIKPPPFVSDAVPEVVGMATVGYGWRSGRRAEPKVDIPSLLRASTLDEIDRLVVQNTTKLASLEARIAALENQ